MKKIIFLVFFLPALVLAQYKGIQFEHHTTWAKVKEKAKASNKHIFVDYHTTWCGPCKYLSKNIFPLEKMGDFFNANFINLKIQMDQTKNDSEDVKSWYAEAKRMEKEFNVRAYPTFLIFNQDGELVHRIMGGDEPDAFIARAKAGLHEETQYETLLRKFELNPSDPATAKNLAIAAQKLREDLIASKAVDAFVISVGTEKALREDNIDFIINAVSSSKSIAYQLVRNHKAKADSLLAGRQMNSNDILADGLMNEYVTPILESDVETVNFDSIQMDLKQKHPYVDMTKALQQRKPSYYLAKKEWLAFRDAVENYINGNPTSVTAQELNSFAWSVVEGCDQPTCIASALAWSNKSIALLGDASFYDTYANLLYKSGDQQKAIAWQEKALNMAAENEKKSYQATLTKMKSGTLNWK